MTARTGRQPARRSILDSPWLAAAIVVVVVGAVAGLIVQSGMFGFGTPASSATPAVPTELAAASPTPQPFATFVRPTPSPPPTFTVHVVRAGDSLNSIARKYDTTGRSIAWWNRGAYPSLDPESADYDPDTVRVGWRLVLIPGTVVDDTNPPTPSPGPTPKATTAS
jgi:hypothetical protein